MPIEPNIPKRASGGPRKCSKCGRVLPLENFAATFSPFFTDGHVDICNMCITQYLVKNDFEWKNVDKVCQWADIPFIVREWTKIKEMNDASAAWGVYSRIFAGREYENLGWADYNKQYKVLQEKGLIEEEIPKVREKKYIDLKRKWGSNYCDEELNYLEDLYKGLKNTQNVNGALQIDQAQKLCKLSLEIDSRIREGDKEVDKFLSSYDKLVKTAEFTPKNSKNAADFDSCAELFFWLEKKGHLNKYYDNVTRDVLDETLKNIENYNRRLYVNEGDIGQEITERIEALKSISDNDNDSVYGIEGATDLDQYDNDGYNFEDNDEFDADLEDDSNV